MTKPSDTFRYDVFISYSSKDEAWVTGTLLPRLEAAGLRICIDFRDFTPGKAAVLNMQDAVEDSRYTLLVMTPEWVASQWTLYESILARAEDPAGLQIRTIPLCLKACEIPKFISMLTWVDFTRPEREENSWRMLLTAVGVPPELETPEAPERPGELLLGCREQELTQMDPHDAVDFFRARGVRGARAEIQAACQPYGYHPLSLRLLAGLIMSDLRQPGDIAAQGLDLAGDLVQRQHHVLAQAYESLPASGRRLLGLIACFRSPVSYDALHALAEAGEKSPPSKRPGMLTRLLRKAAPPERPSPAAEEDLSVALRDLVGRGLLHRRTGPGGDLANRPHTTCTPSCTATPTTGR